MRDWFDVPEITETSSTTLTNGGGKRERRRVNAAVFQS